MGFTQNYVTNVDGYVSGQINVFLSYTNFLIVVQNFMIIRHWGKGLYSISVTTLFFVNIVIVNANCCVE